MANIFDNRTTMQFGLEQKDQQRVRTLAKRLKCHPGWLIMQMTDMLLDEPDALFNFLSRKIKRTGY